MLGYITMCIRENTACAAPETSSVSPSRFWAALCQMAPTATDRVHSGYDVVRILIAAVLLTAAALKGHQLATEPVLGSGLLDSRWFLIGVVEFELFFGLWLLGGLLPKATWAAALMCFGLFACVSLYKALSGHATCGCFGRVPVNPWYTTTLDLAIVVSLVRRRPLGLSFSFGDLTFARSIIILVVWLCFGLPIAFAMGSYTDATLSDAGEIIGNGAIVVLKPETWIGKRFPLLGHVDIGDKLSSGLWLVLLHRHSCSACREAASQYESLAKEFAAKSNCPKIALVEVPPYALKTTAAVDGAWVYGRLSDAEEWQLSGPASVLVNAGNVQNVFSDGREVELARAIWGNSGD
jgi:hypothetical protein